MVNANAILNEFDSVEKSIKRAKLVIEGEMFDLANIEVMIYECLRAKSYLESIIELSNHPSFNRTSTITNLKKIT